MIGLFVSRDGLTKQAKWEGEMGEMGLFVVNNDFDLFILSHFDIWQFRLLLTMAMTTTSGGGGGAVNPKAIHAENTREWTQMKSQELLGRLWRTLNDKDIIDWKENQVLR